MDHRPNGTAGLARATSGLPVPVANKIKNTIVGLRPALEGFVVTMHEGACETGSQIPTA